MFKISNNKIISSLIFGILLLVSSCDMVNKGQLPSSYIDDTTLTSKIKSNLLAEKGLDSTSIHVETLEKEVQLSGFVKDRDAYNKALEIARKTHGVEKVTSKLSIRK